MGENQAGQDDMDAERVLDSAEACEIAQTKARLRSDPDLDSRAIRR